jgi:hypothetical protein
MSLPSPCSDSLPRCSASLKLPARCVLVSAPRTNRSGLFASACPAASRMELLPGSRRSHWRQSNVSTSCLTLSAARTSSRAADTRLRRAKVVFLVATQPVYPLSTDVLTVLELALVMAESLRDTHYLTRARSAHRLEHPRAQCLRFARVYCHFVRRCRSEPRWYPPQDR